MKELKQMARDRDLSGYSSMKKDELVDLIEDNYLRDEINAWSEEEEDFEPEGVSRTEAEEPGTDSSSAFTEGLKRVREISQKESQRGIAGRIGFKRVFQFFLALALISLTADFVITIAGFNRYIAFMEMNPHIMFLMRYMQGTQAASVVFVVTLLFILGSYLLVRDSFKSSPYSGSIRSVWDYLLYSGQVLTRDLAIFALIALYFYLFYIHLEGALTWVRLFTM